MACRQRRTSSMPPGCRPYIRLAISALWGSREGPATGMGLGWGAVWEARLRAWRF